MASRITLLLPLFGLLSGLEGQLPSLQECCEVGRNVAERDRDCSVLPPFTSHVCSIAQEHCCRFVVRDRACKNGVRMARAQGACERPFFTGSQWETQISKICCDCCTLGVKAATEGLSCELPGLQLGKQCASAAKMCCEEPEEIKPTTAGPKDPEVFSTGSPEETNICSDASCAQLCVGNGKCGCYEGFTLQNDSLNCVDVDKCASGTHNCAATSVCINAAGSFLCQPKETCGTGFTRDAAGGCVDISECAADPGPCRLGQTCINAVSSFICDGTAATCPRGYRLSADGTRCQDVDECLIGEKCGSHICVNLEGTYRCDCRPGFTFSAVSKLCQDINECTHYPRRLCAHRCENTAGSFWCGCSLGFKLAHDRCSCDDVDECESKPCSQECTNVHGSYQCYCRRGYQLSDVGRRTCEDIDECATPNICSYICINAPGGFNCTCPPRGYMLAQDGWTCQDIDECAEGTHTCSPVENCFNVRGGFRCFSFECPPNFLRATSGPAGSASEVVRCVKSCHHRDASCGLNPTHIITSTVLSLPTLRDLKQPEEIVLLRTATKASPVPNEPDVLFDILATEKRNSFDVIKTSQNGTIVGVIRQVRPIVGPRELVLKVIMKYVHSGIVSQQNIVIIHVLISEFWF
ncbi:fibulin-1 [Kryptolebias marmoratus]|uniref:Fibulin-1 n=1 Tax=Kryptolebias marmoratus TaxID=37003 RepID=A0A3Q3EFF4_KRYMA|nr:fibulin-1 [Kryptolebias marmoratus]